MDTKWYLCSSTDSAKDDQEGRDLECLLNILCTILSLALGHPRPDYALVKFLLSNGLVSECGTGRKETNAAGSIFSGKISRQTPISSSSAR